MTQGSGSVTTSARELPRARQLIARWFAPLVPRTIAIISFLGGVVLLASGAVPPVASRLRWLEQLVPLPVVEMSHLLGSVGGALLLVVARGLDRRLDSAWVVASSLLAAGVVVSFLRGGDYEAAFVLALMLGVLLRSRPAFYRKGSLLRQPLPARWLLAIGVALAGMAWLVLFSYRHVGYSHELWWRFAVSESAPRSMRAAVAAAVVAAILATVGLLRSATPLRPTPTPSEIGRARAIIAGSRCAASHLALLGDKALLFSDSGRSFLMYGVSGRSWIAMGDPVGDPSECADLVWRLREESDAHNGWAAFYQVPAESLALYVDVGLVPVKIGEEARVPLDGFTLEGSARGGLRHSHSRAQRDGFSFEVISAADAMPMFGELRRISDAWLAARGAREMGFSLGFFDEGYLREGPVALVRRAGEIVAFANCWLGAEKEELSIDLMRYHGDGVHGVMDFLFVELIFWGQREGYRWFNFGLAPLSGLDARALAPLWTQIGAFIFQRGEHVYNFEGLRAYKEKFHPVWAPKYLAAPAGLTLGRVVADLAALTASRRSSDASRDASRASPQPSPSPIIGA